MREGPATKAELVEAFDKWFTAAREEGRETPTDTGLPNRVTTALEAVARAYPAPDMLLLRTAQDTFDAYLATL